MASELVLVHDAQCERATRKLTWCRCFFRASAPSSDLVEMLTLQYDDRCDTCNRIMRAGFVAKLLSNGGLSHVVCPCAAPA